jgi:hypothetical protein
VKRAKQDLSIATAKPISHPQHRPHTISSNESRVCSLNCTAGNLCCPISPDHLQPLSAWQTWPSRLALPARLLRAAHDRHRNISFEPREQRRNRDFEYRTIAAVASDARHYA